MKIEQANKYRENIISLLTAEKLPVTDLPDQLENFAVSKKGDDVTGVIGLEVYGDYALLRSLAVNSNFRNQGIADELLRHIEKLAAAKKT